MADAQTIMQGLSLGFQRYHARKQKLEDEQRTQSFDLKKLGIQHGFDQEDAATKSEQSLRDRLTTFLPNVQGLTLGESLDILKGKTPSTDALNRPIVPPTVQNKQIDVSGQGDKDFLSAYNAAVAQGASPELALKYAIGVHTKGQSLAPAPPPGGYDQEWDTPNGLPPVEQAQSPVIPGVGPVTPALAAGYKKTQLTTDTQKDIATWRLGFDYARLNKQDTWHTVDHNDRVNIARDNRLSNEKIAQLVAGDRKSSLSEKRAEFRTLMELRGKEFGWQKIQDVAALQEKYFSDMNKGGANSNPVALAQIAILKQEMRANERRKAAIQSGVSNEPESKIPEIDDRNNAIRNRIIAITMDAQKKVADVAQSEGMNVAIPSFGLGGTIDAPATLRKNMTGLPPGMKPGPLPEAVDVQLRRSRSKGKKKPMSKAQKADVNF